MRPAREVEQVRPNNSRLKKRQSGNETADLGSITGLLNGNEDMTAGNATATIGDFTMGNFNVSNTHMTNFTSISKLDDATRNDTEALAYGDGTSGGTDTRNLVKQKPVSTPELLGGYKADGRKLYDSSDEEGLGGSPVNAMSPALSDFDFNNMSGVSTKSNTATGNQREIASPDTLSMLLHDVVDSEDDENKEDNDQQNDSNSENTYDLMASILNNVNNNGDTSKVDNTSMNTSNLLERNSSLINTTALLKGNNDTNITGTGAMMAPKPKLKSCFSERKTAKKVNSPRVNFGSPAVAEFNRNTPPISLRKLNKEDSKKLYSIDGSTNAFLQVEDDDPETIANSSVLEEAGEYSDSDDDDSDMQIKGSTASNHDKSTKKSMRRKSSIHGVSINITLSESESKSKKNRRDTLVEDADMSMSSVNTSVGSVAESMDEEISFNHNGSVSLNENDNIGQENYQSQFEAVVTSRHYAVKELACLPQNKNFTIEFK